MAKDIDRRGEKNRRSFVEEERQPRQSTFFAHFVTPYNQQYLMRIIFLGEDSRLNTRLELS
jgi:hypothetical protein